MGSNNKFFTISEVIQETFNHTSVRKTAKENGFFIRSSKITPESFLGLCTYFDKTIGQKTLYNLCNTISYSLHTSISKQALHDRFNDKAVSFLFDIYKQLAASQIGIATHIEVSHLFSRIRIMDSTSFGLEGDYPDYPGFNDSGVSIQFDFDWIQGKFLHQEIHPQTKSDISAARDVMDSLLPGDLLLRDLGYYAANIMEEIDEQGASYISRAPNNTKFWLKNVDKGWTQIKPEEDIKDKAPGETIDYGFIKVGGDTRHSFKGRVVAQKLSSEQQRKRKRALNLKGQRGKDVQSAHQRSNVQVLVTNISREELGPQDLYPLYTLRWQIEILFKAWKSLFDIHNVRKVKQERLECHLYGRLISILLSSMTMFQCRHYLYYKHQKEISEYKALYLIKEGLSELKSALGSGRQAVYELLMMIYENVRRHGVKDHRHNHQSPFDIFDLAYK